MSKGKKKRRKKRFRWLKFLFEVILLAVLAAVLFIGYKFSKITREQLSTDELTVNSEIPSDELSNMKNYRTFALFGVDSRSGQLESGTNSDAIMVCSISRQTHEVRLVSVYRDTWLDTTGGEYRKCTEVYAIGGAAQAISMLNKNLDLNITDYVTVNFEALVELIDQLGGVDITLSEGEVVWLNSYLNEEREVLGQECEDVSGPGLQHLNGMQALAYSRIRYIGLDYERTERQRTVLAQIMEKLQACDLLTINSLVDTILPKVSTSLSVTEILELATGIGQYTMAETEGFPYEKTTMMIGTADCVIPVTLASNVSTLHEYLYDAQDYVPSATVQEISSYIGSYTGTGY